MRPDLLLFGLGPYALFFTLAVVVTSVGCVLFARRRGYAWKDLLVILPTMLLAAVVGGRLVNILTNRAAYDGSMAQMLSLDPRGFSLFGGVALTAVAGLLLCRARRLSVYRFADTLMPLAGLGIALYRVGCFLRGCCFGEATDLPWGVTYPLLSPAHLSQMAASGNYFSVDAVHPTQLYELGAALVLGAIAAWAIAAKKPDGVAFLVFALGFTAFRWFNTTMRVMPETFTASPFLYPTVYAGVLAVLFVLWGRRKLVRQST